MQVQYSRFMRGVDVCDQLRSSYSTAIATKKWWQRLYFMLLDTTLTNAYVMYVQSARRVEERSLSHKDFQLAVGYALMGRTPVAVEDS